jgi:hypothetical protein
VRAGGHDRRLLREHSLLTISKGIGGADDGTTAIRRRPLSTPGSWRPSCRSAPEWRGISRASPVCAPPPIFSPGSVSLPGGLLQDQRDTTQGVRQNSRGPARSAGRSVIRDQLTGCPRILRARRLPSYRSTTMKPAESAWLNFWLNGDPPCYTRNSSAIHRSLLSVVNSS